MAMVVGVVVEVVDVKWWGARLVVVVLLVMSGEEGWYFGGARLASILSAWLFVKFSKHHNSSFKWSQPVYIKQQGASVSSLQRIHHHQP